MKKLIFTVTIPFILVLLFLGQLWAEETQQWILKRIPAEKHHHNSRSTIIDTSNEVIPKQITPARNSILSLPDLYAEGIYFSSDIDGEFPVAYPTEGQLVYYQFYFTNIGDEPATHFTLISAIDGIVHCEYFVSDTVETNSYWQLTCADGWTALKGIHRFTSYVDFNGLVTEGNESNNSVNRYLPIPFNLPLNTFGYPPGSLTTDNMFSTKHNDVIGQYFTIPMTGKIDTISWMMGDSIGAVDSILYLRVFKSNISDSSGPGYEYPSAPTAWGYYINTNDADQGISAFQDEATDTNWVSTVSGDTPSFPPFPFLDKWGFGGYPVKVHKKSVVSVSMNDLGSALNVKQGDVIFVTLKVNSPVGHINDPSTLFYTGEPDTSDFPHLWKFYEHDSSGSGLPKGWAARGQYNMYMWYCMNAETQPVVTESNPITSSFSTGPNIVSASIVDTYSAHPESAGVRYAFLSYQVNGISKPLMAMTHGTGSQWSATIPGQVTGSYVDYKIIAYNRRNMISTTTTRRYHVTSFQSNYYLIDTIGTYEPTLNIDSGSVIDSDSWFKQTITGNKPDGNDGTAGPFELGSPFLYFGDTMHYVWIGVNGAIALSKYATDTIDINSNGSWTDKWDFPQPQQHSRSWPFTFSNKTPKALISPYWANWITSDQNHNYGKVMYFKNEYQFVVEWDSLGRFSENEVVEDVAKFRVILDLSKFTIEFQYDHIGETGQELYNLVGIQADSNYHHQIAGTYAPYNIFNKDGYPLETKLHNGFSVRFSPIAFTFNTVKGWNLVSNASQSPNNALSYIYPNASTKAYGYNSGYIENDTLTNGIGYWLKFTSNQVQSAKGSNLLSTSIQLKAKWNLVGSLSVTVPVSSITSDPPGLIVSQFFGYDPNAGYSNTTDLIPGKAYWVKSAQAGIINLNSTLVMNKSLPNATIKIIAGEELPPPPPDGEYINNLSGLPKFFALDQNYPNPFNPITIINYQLPVDSRVTLKIYNLLGGEIARLINGVEEAGYKSVSFDASRFASGLYFYKIEATGEDNMQQSFTQVRKMLLIK